MTAPRTREYRVTASFPNPNADYTFSVQAFSEVNAMWIAAERLIGTGAYVGEIRPA